MLPDTLNTTIGIIVGIVFVVPTIYLIDKREIGERAWPFFLASLPVWYMLFGVLALDTTAIALEAVVGLPYFITGLITWRIRSRLLHAVLGFAWLSHGLYDYYHDLFFINPGVFAWYPVFCAVVDIAVGGYLLVHASLAYSKRRRTSAP